MGKGGSRGRREGPRGTQGVKADPRSPPPPIPGNWNPHGLVGVGGGVSRPVGKDTCGQYTCWLVQVAAWPAKRLAGEPGSWPCPWPSSGAPNLTSDNPLSLAQTPAAARAASQRRRNSKVTYPTPSRPSAPLPDSRPWLHAADTLGSSLRLGSEPTPVNGPTARRYSSEAAAKKGYLTVQPPTLRGNHKDTEVSRGC